MKPNHFRPSDCCYQCKYINVQYRHKCEKHNFTFEGQEQYNRMCDDYVNYIGSFRVQQEPSLDSDIAGVMRELESARESIDAALSNIGRT